MISTAMPSRPGARLVRLLLLLMLLALSLPRTTSAAAGEQPLAGAPAAGPLGASLSRGLAQAETADLAISKSDGLDEISAGSAITYTIVVSNSGPLDASDITIRDHFSGALGVVSWSCDAQGGATCPSASGNGSLQEDVSLPAGGRLTYTASGSVSPDFAGTLRNTAWIDIGAECVECEPSVDDPNLENNRASDTTIVIAQADLSVLKSDSADPLPLGSPLTYTIVVRNDGPSSAATALLSDTLPPSVTFASVSTTLGSCSHDAGQVTCDLSQSAPQPISSILLVDDSTFEGQESVQDFYTAALEALGYSYTLFETNEASRPDAATLAAYDLVIWFGGAFGGPTGDDEAALSYYLESGGRLFLSAQDYHFNHGEITTVFMADYLGVDSVDSDIEPAYTVVSGTNVLAGHDGYALSTPFEIYYDNIRPSLDGAAAVVGDEGSTAGIYSLDGRTVFFAFPWESVQNESPADGQALLQSVIDHLSARLYTTNLAAGAQATVTVVVTPTASGLITNSVVVGANSRDPNPADNQDDETTLVVQPWDLAISKSDGLETIVAGDPITYTIVVSNTGMQAVPGARVVDNFSAELENRSWSCSATPGSSCALAGGSTSINTTVDLAAGGSATFIIRGLVDEFAFGGDGLISNSASVSPPDGMEDPDTRNNSSTDTTTVVERQADLAISKSDGLASALPGDPITYTIVVDNNGPHTATGIIVRDLFSGVLGVVSWSCDAQGGAVCPSTSGSGNLQEVVDLPAGGRLTYSASGSISPDFAGTLRNTAWIELGDTCGGDCTPSLSDPNLENNRASDTTIVIAQADLSVIKSDSADPLPLGSPLTYTIVVRNDGPAAATALLTDTLPPGVTFGSASTTLGSCSHDAGLVTCTLSQSATQPISSILLVDEDGGFTNVESYYTSALDALGYSYSVFQADQGNRPDAATLAAYDLVIWFGGGYNGPTSDDEAVLAGYLESGGRLFLSAQDYHFNHDSTTPFMADYLGVDYVDDDIEPAYTVVSGTNVLAGHDGYALTPLTEVYYDRITPNEGGAAAVVGDEGSTAGIYSLDGRTVFFAFPWESVQNESPADGQALLQSVIDHLSARLYTTNLAAGAQATVTVVVTPTASGLITNSVVVGAAVLDPNPANNQDDETTLVIQPRVEQQSTYLPMLTYMEPAQLPDLVVQQISVTEKGIQVVVKNQGPGPVTSGFWVDLYINPNRPPVAVNDVWHRVGRYGAVWGVPVQALPLAPGAELTLTLGDAYYWAQESDLPASIPAGSRLYAQVDSANTNSPIGGVLETHEAAGGSYNNITGPLITGAVITPSAQAAPLDRQQGASLPDR